MGFQWIAAPFGLISLIALAIALYCLVARRWLLGWLRGNAGFLLLVVAVLTGLTAFNVNGYRRAMEEVPLAVVSFTQIDDQLFSAKLEVAQTEPQQSYQIYGDLWQVDARIIKWKGLLARLGAHPSYKLERLQGRYFTLEDEQNKPRSVFALSDPDLGFNLWAMVNRLSNHLDWFDAEYGTATFLPMADQAAFSIQLSQTGLVARPINRFAERAINNWE